MKSIVLITNHLTPYRRKFYDDFHKTCQNMGITFTVLLMTKREPKRNWDYDDLMVDYAILMNDIHFTFPINNHLNIEIINRLKRLNPDLVLMAGSYMYFTNWLVLLNKKRLKFPVVYWNEAHFAEKRYYSTGILKVRDSIRSLIFPRFDGFWFSGAMSEKFVSYYGNPHSKKYFVPNFIDNNIYDKTRSKSLLDRQNLRNKWNLDLESKIAIIPARLSKEKGIDKFLKLLTEIQLPKNLIFLVPGTGDFQEEILKAASQSGVNVRLLGFQKQAEMLELYCVSDLFILPSLSDPNPLTCIEALWCGLPLLVTVHVGNHPEVIRDGVNGYVFDYSNKAESVTKIQRFFNQSNAWYLNAKFASIEIARKVYDPKPRVSKLIQEMMTDFFIH